MCISARVHACLRSRARAQACEWEWEWESNSLHIYTYRYLSTVRTSEWIISTALRWRIGILRLPVIYLVINNSLKWGVKWVASFSWERNKREKLLYPYYQNISPEISLWWYVYIIIQHREVCISLKFRWICVASRCECIPWAVVMFPSAIASGINTSSVGKIAKRTQVNISLRNKRNRWHRSCAGT